MPKLKPTIGEVFIGPLIGLWTKTFTLIWNNRHDIEQIFVTYVYANVP